MNWTIIIIETIVLTLAFTAMILIPLVKNPVWWIADYPEDIQEEYFKTHERIPSKFFSPTVLLKKGMALLIALALLLVVVKLAGAYDFWSALVLSSILLLSRCLALVTEAGEMPKRRACSVTEN